MTSNNLPEELVHEILLRLPVKTLLQCKCVCKQWYAVISSSSFVKRHYEHESNQQRLMIRLKKPDGRGYMFVLCVDDTFSNYEAEEPSHLQIYDQSQHSTLIGPLNGVFCATNGSLFGPFALLNPALRQFKPLPALDQRFYPTNKSSINSEVGLGLDPLAGDHKLVLIVYYWGGSGRMVDQDYYSDYYTVVYVCTSGSDSWRVLEDVDPIVSRRMANTSVSNTFLNGTYYWLLEFKFSGTAATDVAVVLAFDMRTERFRGMEVRGGVSESEVGTLALCGSSLTLLMFERSKSDGCIDVWTMKDEETWIRSSKVGPLGDMYWVLCFWKNNELLLETMDSFLALYNVSTGKLKTTEAQKANADPHVNWWYVYKESLVPIEGKSLVSIEGKSEKSKIPRSSGFIRDFFKCLSL